MPRDIRSFFKPLNKNAPTVTSQKESKKKPIVISEDEDIIPASPASERKKSHSSKRTKPIVLDSDSDDNAPSTPISASKSKHRKTNGAKKEQLKPVNAIDLFSSTPVKQSKLAEKPNTKVEERKNAFDKTLQELDDELDGIDMVDLDRTINDAEATVSTKQPSTPSSTKTPTRKRKAEVDLNESGLDPDQERHEKKRYSAMLYAKYLNRSKPEHKGEKEMPQGEPNCLRGLCFLKTGVLESLEYEDLNELVQQYGGRTVKAVSRKVNFLVVGDDPGPSKLEKARSFGIKEITENELLDMILVKSGKPAKYCQNNNEETVKLPEKDKQTRKSPEKEKQTRKSPEKEKQTKKSPEKEKLRSKSQEKEKQTKKSPEKEKHSKTEMRTPKKAKDNESKTPAKPVRVSPRKLNKTEKIETKTTNGVALSTTIAETKPFICETAVQVSEDHKAWTEKYKPSNIQSIIGQQDGNSNMRKLLNWLTNWNKNHVGKNKPKLMKPSPWAKNDDGAYYKCALLSGPPGVGKTTTATLVAQELGFDMVEFNASDTRNKKLLHEEISQLLSTKSIANYFKDGSAPTSKHVLLMDEVDGMSGNQDRGGIQELISLIKNSSVPIICMCNDRQHPKIRSLVNYCYDLRFGKMKVEQIRGAMMSVCFKEGLKISPQVLSQIITSTGMDVRQTLNHLSLWSAADKNLSSEMVNEETEKTKKDTNMGNWEMIRKVFSAEEHKSMSTADKSKLFFYDYSIGPLFVQENYLQVEPNCPKKEQLERVALTADSLSMGDVIEAKIRSSNNWSLMESQAFHSSVMPGHYMAGRFTGQINFPGWLGKNSKRGKFQRLASELQSHMRISTSASREAVNLDYIYHLRKRIVDPLVQSGTDGIDESVQVMRDYCLLREDLDSILELSMWPKKKDPMSLVETKVKAAFTRAYNKNGPILPYSLNTAVTKKKTSVKDSQEEAYGDEEEYESDAGDDDDIAKDAMIKEKKKPAVKGGKKTSEQASTSKKPAASKGGRAKKPK